MLLQKIERQDRISPDVVVAKEGQHLFIRHRSDFRSAVNGVVQLCHTWNIELVLSQQWLEPFKILRTLVLVEMRDRRSGW